MAGKLNYAYFYRTLTQEAENGTEDIVLLRNDVRRTERAPIKSLIGIFYSNKDPFANFVSAGRIVKRSDMEEIASRYDGKFVPFGKTLI